MYEPYRPEDWCWDRYAKECDRCDTVVGRFGVLRDAEGWRHVVWWPHRRWGGVDGSYRCGAHSDAPKWRRLVG